MFNLSVTFTLFHSVCLSAGRLWHWAKQSWVCISRLVWVSRPDKWMCQWASSHQTRWEASVHSRRSVCCFRLNCAECCARVRTSPSASVYLTSPRFKLTVDTLLSYEFSFQTGWAQAFATVESFFYPLASRCCLLSGSQWPRLTLTMLIYCLNYMRLNRG